MNAADVTPERIGVVRGMIQHELPDTARRIVLETFDAVCSESSNLRAAILEYQQAPAAMEASADREIEYLQGELDRLRSKLAARSVAVEVPDRSSWLTIDEMADQAEKGWATHYGMEPISRSAAMQIARRIAKASMEKGERLHPSSTIKDGEDQFALGFVEACAILAAKPFDQPTLAAGIIKEGGYQDDLAGTSSDYAGIEILRRELGISALRSGEAEGRKG